MVCAHQILFILPVTYGAERTEAHGICIQRMEQKKRKETQTKWKSHSGYLLCRAEIYIHHCYTLLHSIACAPSKQTHIQCQIEYNENKRRRMKAFLFVSVNKQRSRDNINIKFIYPLQIWCEVYFFSAPTFPPQYYTNWTQPEVKPFELSRLNARCTNPATNANPPVINTKSYPSIPTYGLSMCRRLFSAPQFHFDWAI